MEPVDHFAVGRITLCQQDRQFGVRSRGVAGGGNPRHLTYAADGIVQEVALSFCIGLADAVVSVEVGVDAVTQYLAQTACNILFIGGGLGCVRRQIGMVNMQKILKFLIYLIIIFFYYSN